MALPVLLSSRSLFRLLESEAVDRSEINLDSYEHPERSQYQYFQAAIYSIVDSQGKNYCDLSDHLEIKM